MASCLNRFVHDGSENKAKIAALMCVDANHESTGIPFTSPEANTAAKGKMRHAMMVAMPFCVIHPVMV